MYLTDAQQRIVEDNSKLVYYLVSKMTIASSYYEDAIQYGMIGLCKGVVTFDENKNIKFATYVSKCIVNEIYMFFRKNNKHLKVSSIDGTLLRSDEDNDTSEINRLISLLAAEEEVEDEIIQKDEFEYRINLILNFLNSNERYLVLLKLSGYTQQEIGKVIGWSQSYISRVEKRITNKLIQAENFENIYRKVYKFIMKPTEYVLSFSSKNAQDFPKILGILFEKLAVSESLLTDFKLICDKERIAILLPKENRAFSFIAQIIKEIDCFTLEYRQKEVKEEKDAQVTTKEALANNESEKEKIFGEIPTDDISDVDAVEENIDAIKKIVDAGESFAEVETVVVPKQSANESDAVEDAEEAPAEYETEEDAEEAPAESEAEEDAEEALAESEAEEDAEEAPAESEAEEDAEEAPTESEAEEDAEEAPAENETVVATGKNPVATKGRRKGMHNPVYDVVMDYIKSKEVIYFRELEVAFPDVGRSTLNNIVYKARKNDLLESSGRGRYKVKK